MQVSVLVNLRSHSTFLPNAQTGDASGQLYRNELICLDTADIRQAGLTLLNGGVACNQANEISAETHF